MNRLLLLLLFFGLQALGQPLQTINYNYLYNPKMPFTFELKLIPAGTDSLRVFYQLSIQDTLQTTDGYTISWESFESLSDKEGEPFYPAIGFQRYANHLYGTFTIKPSQSILAAKVISNSLKIGWYYVKVIDPHLSQNGVVLTTQKLVSNYVTLPSTLHVKNGHSSSVVFYYKENFPAATPAFSETQGSINRSWQPDSIFTIGTTFNPFAKGLYLIQSDTSGNKGICFRAEENYPKFSTLESLIGPLTYITTKNEYERLRNAQHDKKAFDKIILGITGNAERAKIFMRNYFKRVETANHFFTSYKEGWKTDRGMLYIIFGEPNFVYKFSEREVWEYKTADGQDVKFTFVRSSSLFDPENYVLARKRTYQQLWLEIVDLNRNARF